MILKQWMSSLPLRVLASLVGVFMILVLLGMHDTPEYIALADHKQSTASLFPLTSQLQIGDEYTFNPAKDPQQHHLNLDNNAIVMTFHYGHGGSDSLVHTDRE